MAHHNTREEQEFLKLIKNLPFPEETRADWVNRVDNDGMTKELVDEIQAALTGPTPEGVDQTDMMQLSANYTRIVRQWRLTQRTKSFRKY